MTLYRTHRPKKFSEVIGQKHITQTLQNQMARNDVSHAYLFTGTRGTGKTSIAKIFARELNGNKGDLDIFELDAASNNRVEDVRDIIEKTKYPPTFGKYKIYIVDEVHMFSPSAFNAFLKTLEEPPSYIIFILCTTEAHKIPKTVLSRCLRFDFRPAPTSDIIKLLTDVFKKEKITAKPAAIERIATAAAGSFRDALSLAQTVISYATGEITEADVATVIGSVGNQLLKDLLQHILNKDVKAATGITQKIFSEGLNINLVIRDFLQIVLHSHIEKPDERLVSIYRTFAELELNIKTALDAQALFEGACLLG